MSQRFALTGPGDRPRATHRARVGYVDTDKAGVVHHTVYLVWMEAARIELLRGRGLDYARLEIETGVGMPVVEARVRYLAPARFDDEIEIETWCSSCTRAKVVFESRIRRGGEVICEGIVTTACVDLREARACSVPDAVRRACG